MVGKEGIMEQNWTFRGRPLILKPWSPQLDLQKLDVQKIPVWVQFPDPPLSCWTQKIIGKIASFLGVHLATGKLTYDKARIAYARVLIEMQVGDELIYEIPVKDEGGKFIQHVHYEWKPLRCTRCKQLGHNKDGCMLPEKLVWVTKPGIIEEIQEVQTGVQISESTKMFLRL